MSRPMKLFFGIVTVALVLYAGLRWALGTPPVPEQPEQPYVVQQWRDAVTSADASLPIRIDRIVVAEGEFPAFAVIAGRSLFDKQRMIFQTHILRYEDGSSVVIDPVHDAEQHARFFGDGFDAEEFERMQDELQAASMIIATHEHVDHVAGISRSPYFDSIVANTRLTREQIKSPKIADADFSEEQLQRLPVLDYEGIYSPAPGVVLQKAPGHTPGGQLSYVPLQDGREYLFIGDVAWAYANLEERRGRPRLVSRVFLGEDPVAVADQLAALAALADERIEIIVSHDEIPDI